MTKAGGARTIRRPTSRPSGLARQIEAMAADPIALANAAARALSVGRPNAARDLADLVERIGGGWRRSWSARRSPRAQAARACRRATPA